MLLIANNPFFFDISILKKFSRQLETVLRNSFARRPHLRPVDTCASSYWQPHVTIPHVGTWCQSFHVSFAHMPDESRLATARLAADGGTLDALRRTRVQCKHVQCALFRACVRHSIHGVSDRGRPNERVDSLKILTKLSVNTGRIHHFIFSGLSKLFWPELQHFYLIFIAITANIVNFSGDLYRVFKNRQTFFQ